MDFDGTLCENEWPEIGKPNQIVIKELIKQQADGAKLILWTCREGDRLQAAVTWCLEHGLKFDAVNDNLEENKVLFGKRRKVYKVKIVSAGFEVMRPQKMDEASRKAIYSAIEQAGRVCYKTEVVMTGASHPQMREVALPLLRELAGYLPALFGDLLEV